MSNENKTCTVSAALLMDLIESVVHTLASSEYVPQPDDEHYRGLVTSQVESILALAEEAGVDLWGETTAPVGREMMPIAYLLREADREYGLPRACPVAGCTEVPVSCCPRPLHLPAGTRWPSAPELCGGHTEVRLDVLRERVRQRRPDHHRPIHAAGMPMPPVLGLAPTPAELTRLNVS
jgi:hypothetical protein